MEVLLYLGATMMTNVAMIKVVDKLTKNKELKEKKIR